MFRIRRVHDTLLSSNLDAVRQVQALLSDRIPLAAAADVREIPELLRDPLKKQLGAMLWVAEDGKGVVRGFALMLYAPDLGLAWLDWISAARTARSGVGGALYERVREAAVRLGAPGIFLECAPDDPAVVTDPKQRAENVRRLEFYARYGARPIIGTDWEKPVPSGDDAPPVLVFDDLGRETALGRDRARVLARAILERKYRELCPPDYIDAVVGSFTDDPIRLRPLAKAGASSLPVPVATVAADDRIALFVHDKHAIHHVRERG